MIQIECCAIDCLFCLFSCGFSFFCLSKHNVSLHFFSIMSLTFSRIISPKTGWNRLNIKYHISKPAHKKFNQMETVKWIFASHIEKNYHKNEDISHSYSDICKATDCFFSAVLMWFFSLDDALSLYCYLMQPFLIFILWSSYESIYFACHIVCAFVFFFTTRMNVLPSCQS